jgi:hypothetical protein
MPKSRTSKYKMVREENIERKLSKRKMSNIIMNFLLNATNFGVWMWCVDVVCECGYGWMHMLSSLHTHSVLTHWPIHTLTHTHSHPPTPTLTSVPTHTLTLVWCCKQHFRICWFVEAISGTWTCIHKKNIFIIHWKRLIRRFRSRKILKNALYLKNEHRNKRKYRTNKMKPISTLLLTSFIIFDIFLFDIFLSIFSIHAILYFDVLLFRILLFDIFLFDNFFDIYLFDVFLFDLFRQPLAVRFISIVCNKNLLTSI